MIKINEPTKIYIKWMLYILILGTFISFSFMRVNIWLGCVVFLAYEYAMLHLIVHNKLLIYYRTEMNGLYAFCTLHCALDIDEALLNDIVNKKINKRKAYKCIENNIRDHLFDLIRNHYNYNLGVEYNENDIYIILKDICKFIYNCLPGLIEMRKKIEHAIKINSIQPNRNYDIGGNN